MAYILCALLHCPQLRQYNSCLTFPLLLLLLQIRTQPHLGCCLAAATAAASAIFMHLCTNSATPYTSRQHMRSCNDVNGNCANRRSRLTTAVAGHGKRRWACTSMHSCTNHATLPTSSHCINSLKLDTGRPAKRKIMSLVLSHENNKCSSSSIGVTKSSPNSLLHLYNKTFHCEVILHACQSLSLSYDHYITLHYTKAVRHVLAHWAAGLCRAFKGKSKIEYHMVWYECKLTLLSLNVKEMSLLRAAAFSLQLCPFLNSTPKPPEARLRPAQPPRRQRPAPGASLESASACQTASLG
jgi:hypothetical protein